MVDDPRPPTDDCMDPGGSTEDTSSLNLTPPADVTSPPALASTVTRQGSFHIAYLFSGPERSQDGFATQVKSLGGVCVCFDKEISDSHDMLDQHGWERIDDQTSDCDGFLMSPPCCTFSPARNAHDGGPQPLRSAVGSEIYGFKDLRPADKEKVREGNVLALRAHGKASKAYEAGKPFMIEQPHHRPGKTSMFLLKEFQELLSRPGINKITLAQCRFGGIAEKLTDLITNISEEECEPLIRLCNHPKRWWTIPWSGKRVYSAHPPLVGTQLAIPSEDWTPDMLAPSQPSGDFLTRAAAAYPAGLNKELASVFCRAILARQKTQRTISQLDSMQTGELNNTVNMGLPLRGQQGLGYKQDDEKFSLRNIHASVSDKALNIGKQIANLIELKISQDNVEDAILSNIGRPMDEVSIPEDWLENLRIEVVKLLARNRSEDMPGSCDVGTINNEHYQTSIRGHLLEYWARTVEDPGSDLARWTYEGAPAGMECQTSELDGVCPRVDDSEEHTSIDLATDYDTFENYQGVEDDPEAAKAIHQYLSKGYLQKFDKLEDLQHFVGGQPVLSKLGCIKKMKYNPDTQQYTQKVRIILDCKQSNVSVRATRTHKSVLPRVSDAVQAALYLSADRMPEEMVQMFIIDIVDAFWLIPLRHSERKYFCAKLHGQYFAFLRTAQGSRGAPLTFAALIALAARLIQSLISGPQIHRWAREEGRMNVYVDDPIVVMRGNERRIKRVASIVIIGWLLLGFPLAFHKAILSPTVLWVGITLQIDDDKVRAEVPESKVVELKDLLVEALKSNVVSCKSLRTIIGKAMAIASVIYVWRPFVQELYSALHCTESHAPKGCVWTKQISHSFHWILAFLAGEHSSLVRDYSLAHFRREGPEVVITWDASPWGMGATLQVSGQFVEFFAIPIDPIDETTLQTPKGSSEGQQVWEALAGLVALRVWSRFWQGQRARLHVRGDNVGALTLFSTLKSGSPPLTKIAREFALDLGKAEYRPDLVQHIPGIVNKVNDCLSRRFQPGQTFQLPPCLNKARPIRPVRREEKWWKSTAAPLSSSAEPMETMGRPLKARKFNV